MPDSRGVTQMCKGMPGPKKTGDVSVIKAPILCGTHANVIRHMPKSPKGYSTCYMRLYQDGQLLAQSNSQEYCLSDYAENIKPPKKGKFN